MKPNEYIGFEMSRSFTENLKQEGWNILACESLPVDERAKGLLMVILNHWERSHHKTMEIPEFHVFVCHWLVANGDRINEQDVVEWMRKRFPKPRKVKIKKGSSYWNTA